MQKFLDYRTIKYKDKCELFNELIDILYYSKEEFLEEIKGKVLAKRTIKFASPELAAERERERDLFQWELENMLEEYDLEKMARFNYSLDSFLCYKEEFRFKEGKLWELIYWYIFHDQEGYRSELVRSSLDELNSIEFGFPG